MENVLRASYTVLKMWSDGNVQGAIDTYLRRQREANRAMVEGSNYHKAWQAEIQATRSLPKVFGAVPLKNPYTEQRFEAQVTDWMSLRGIIDCYDGPTIHEFKTGSTPAADYANSMQAEVYAWLLAENGIKATKAIYHVYNQHLREVQSAIVWITDERLSLAVEWMVTFASDMHHYFTENGIYEMESATKEVTF